MGLLSRFLESRWHPSNPDAWALRGGLDNAAGVELTIQGSLQSTAVYACVRVLSETVGMLPFITYKRLSRGKDRATEHPLYWVLHSLPNPEMTAMEFREALMGHLALWGNAFAEIEYDGAGRVKYLWPLRADKVKVTRIGGELKYIVRMNKGPDVELPYYRVMHLRGLSYDGIVGYSPIDLARQAVALSLATEEFGARLFKNGTALNVVYKHPAKLSDEAYTRLQKSLEKRHQGLSNAHRIAILEEGMEAQSIGIPPENAQFLETRKFQKAEIASLYRMPPHKIGHLEDATFSNIEHQAIEFVTDTIQPWLTRWEQAVYRDLLVGSERRTYFAEHLIAALLRGDTLSRYQAYQIGRQGGWLSANDIRERENDNPIEGGDVYLVPLNMVPADQLTEPAPTGNPDGDPPDGRGVGSWERRGLGNWGAELRARKVAKSRQRLAKSFYRLFEDTAKRVYRREIADVRRAVGKYLGKRDAFEFSTWLKQFYAEHKDFFRRQFLPILLSYADQMDLAIAEELDSDPGGDITAFIDQYVEALAAREAGSSQLQLQALLDQALQNNENPEEVITQRLDEWEQKRPGKLAGHEASNAGNALAKAFYVLAGVQRLRWVATGETCPYCRDLDGKIVGVRASFIEAGQDYKPEGAERPLNKRHSVGHPPVHDGCDCSIVAER